MEIVQRELIYLWYYFSAQLDQIFWYWVLGMLIGSAVSVFLKDHIHEVFRSLGNKKLGSTALAVRIISCFLCGIVAGLLIRFFYRNKTFFNFDGFEEPKSHDTDPNIIVRYLKNLWRNIKATGLYFLFGIILSALFQRYVSTDVMTSLFGGNEAFGVLMAATIGVPLYACGGGTIPLLQQWLWDGMPMGSAAAFMITGPATKITNLGALKIVLGMKRFLIYIAYVMWFSLTTGLIVNLIV